MLEIAGLEAGYGGAQVLFGVDLRLHAGTIAAVMGRNGMGKTTLLKAIMGLVPVGRGRIGFGGHELAGLPSHRIARLGVGYVPQGRDIFTELTVEENLHLGVLGHAGLTRAIPARLVDLFPVIDTRRRQRAGSLSGGEQQQLAIARALMGRPRLLLLDEPSEGVQPSIVEAIGAALLRIAAEDDIAILLVEQSLDLALTVAGSVLFMEEGRIVAEASPDELNASPDLLDRYLGL